VGSATPRLRKEVIFKYRVTGAQETFVYVIHELHPQGDGAKIFSVSNIVPGI
jgi:hypothetical protein